MSGSKGILEGLILNNTVTSSKTDTLPNTSSVTKPEPSPDTSTGTCTNTVTDTVTDMVTSPLIKPSEILFRMIGYYTESQRKFIKNKAKKYKVTEAEIMRIAVEELMKSGKI